MAEPPGNGRFLHFGSLGEGAPRRLKIGPSAHICPIVMRDVKHFTASEVRSASRDLVALVDARLPTRVYWRGQTPWDYCGPALISRAAGLVESMALLADAQRPSDVLVLLRVLYEHIVTFCWLAIDPAPRIEQWADHAVFWQKKLHGDAAQWGHEVLTEAELDAAATARPLVSLDKRAAEIDEHWGPRIRGFRPADDLLSFRGLYTHVYRVASRAVHAQVETLDGSIDSSGYPWVVRREQDDSMYLPSLAVPLFAMALLVCAERFSWPDPDRVRAINDAFFARLADEQG